MGWLIFFGILLFFFLLGLIPVGIRLRFSEEARIDLKILFFSFPLSPKKTKKLRLSRYRIDRFRKMRIKQRAKSIKKARKDAEKKAEKQAKKDAEKENGKNAKKKTVNEKISEITDTVSYFKTIATDVALVFLNRFYRGCHFKIRRLVIVCATGDAAKTAVSYGLISAGVADLLAFLENTTHLHIPRRTAIRVIPDFVGETPKIEADLTVSVRVGTVLSLAVGAIRNYCKILINRKSK